MNARGFFKKRLPATSSRWKLTRDLLHSGGGAATAPAEITAGNEKRGGSALLIDTLITNTLSSGWCMSPRIMKNS